MSANMPVRETGRGPRMWSAQLLMAAAAGFAFLPWMRTECREDCKGAGGANPQSVTMAGVELTEGLVVLIVAAFAILFVHFGVPPRLLAGMTGLVAVAGIVGVASGFELLNSIDPDYSPPALASIGLALWIAIATGAAATYLLTTESMKRQAAGYD